MSAPDQPRWLVSLDDTIAQLGTPEPAPFPPTPIPRKPGAPPCDPCRNGACGNGWIHGPDHRDQTIGAGPAKPLRRNEGPAGPDGPAPEKGLHENFEREVGTGRTFPVPTSDFRARVEYQKDRDHRDHRDQSIETFENQRVDELALGPDPVRLVPMIGTKDADLLDAFEERAAILQHDGGLARADAEALAFAEVITLTCGPGSGRDDQLRTADRLDAIGITIPTRWRPTAGG